MSTLKHLALIISMLLCLWLALWLPYLITHCC